MTAAILAWSFGALFLVALVVIGFCTSEIRKLEADLDHCKTMNTEDLAVKLFAELKRHEGFRAVTGEVTDDAESKGREAFSAVKQEIADPHADPYMERVQLAIKGAQDRVKFLSFQGGVMYPMKDGPNPSMTIRGDFKWSYARGGFTCPGSPPLIWVHCTYNGATYGLLSLVTRYPDDPTRVGAELVDTLIHAIAYQSTKGNDHDHNT